MLAPWQKYRTSMLEHEYNTRNRCMTLQEPLQKSVFALANQHAEKHLLMSQLEQNEKTTNTRRKRSEEKFFCEKNRTSKSCDLIDIHLTRQKSTLSATCQFYIFCSVFRWKWVCEFQVLGFSCPIISSNLVSVQLGWVVPYEALHVFNILDSIR